MGRRLVGERVQRRAFTEYQMIVSNDLIIKSSYWISGHCLIIKGLKGDAHTRPAVKPRRAYIGTT
jgi:hypothetical protein